MKITACIAIVGLASVASAEVLLEIDLSVANTITITATDGLAVADSTAQNAIGFAMDGFFAPAANVALFASSSGNLTTANETSDGTPNLWSWSSDAALNVYGFATSGTVSTTAGQVAFSGSATWSVAIAADYLAMLAGNSTGDVYMGTDNDDLTGATFVGTWVVIPAPSSLALLGLGGMVAGRRRR